MDELGKQGERAKSVINSADVNKNNNQPMMVMTDSEGVRTW